MKCPICDSVMKETKKKFPVVVGNAKNIAQIYSHVCPFCGYDENDKRNKRIISKAVNGALASCSIEILRSWKTQNKSFSEVERSFLLPVRTLSKWLNKSVKPSAAATSLLRIINAFPWMEKVADLGFETEMAKEYVRNYYISEFNDYDKQITYTGTPLEHIYTAVIKKANVSKASIIKDNFINYKNLKYIPEEK